MSKRKGLSKRVRFEVFKRDSFKCQYCGASSPDVLLQVDHIHPIAKGGDEADITNLITSCESCNSGKSDKLLSETAAASKRKAQLDQLQERREQLEMMAEWQRGLIDLDEQATGHCFDFVNSLLQPFGMHLNESARAEVRAHVKKFGMTLVMESIRAGFTFYIKRTSDGKLDIDSWDRFWSKLGGICTVKRREQEHPEEAELYRIRAYAKKHLGYFVDWEALKLLQSAQSWNVDVRDMWEVARESSSYTKFKNRLTDLIIEARRREGEA